MFIYAKPMKQKHNIKTKYFTRCFCTNDYIYWKLVSKVHLPLYLPTYMKYFKYLSFHVVVLLLLAAYYIGICRQTYWLHFSVDIIQ